MYASGIEPGSGPRVLWLLFVHYGRFVRRLVSNGMRQPLQSALCDQL